MRFEAETRIARIGQALSHPLRVRALGLMFDGERHRAGALARRLHVALPLLKQHLLRLLEAELIAAERDGDAVYYRVAAAADAIRPMLVPRP